MGTLPRYSDGTELRAATAFGDTRSSFTDLLGGPETGRALIIDPVLETARCDLQRLGGLGLELGYVIDTHVHVEPLGGPTRAHPERGAALMAKQSPLPRSWVRLRKVRVAWNKVPSRVFSLPGVRLRPTRARRKPPNSKIGEHLQEECRMGIDDTELLAYVDGHLPRARRAEVEAAAASSPGVAARLNAMRASALRYAAAFDAQVLPALPPELEQRVGDLLSACARQGRRRESSWPRLAVAFAAGTLCCAIALKLLPSAALPDVAAVQVSPWIKAVADYQQLYSRATLANVTEDPALSARVINALHVNDGIAVIVPDLRGAGLTFKRVQRLSFHDRPVVQMVYLPEQGEPIALCVTPDTRPDEAPHAQQIGEMSGVAWRRDNLGYVVLSKGPAGTLLELGRRIASGDTRRLYGRSSTPPARQAA